MSLHAASTLCETTVALQRQQYAASVPHHQNQDQDHRLRLNQIRPVSAAELYQ